jgi:hypothetical protein
MRKITWGQTHWIPKVPNPLLQPCPAVFQSDGQRIDLRLNGGFSEEAVTCAYLVPVSPFEWVVGRLYPQAGSVAGHGHRSDRLVLAPIDDVKATRLMAPGGQEECCKRVLCAAHLGINESGIEIGRSQSASLRSVSTRRPNLHG